jgi:hypothetical protein
MAIMFACKCGKQMQARDEFAGRRMKCPSCQSIVTIPTAPPATVVAPEVTQPAAAAVTLPTEVVVPAAAVAPPVATAPAQKVTAAPDRNPWADRSLEQCVTPWQGDDASRLGDSWESRDRRRSGGGELTTLVVLLALVAAAALAWCLWTDIRERREHPAAPAPVAAVRTLVEGPVVAQEVQS